MRIAFAAIMASALALGSLPAGAQEQPVKFIVPYPAGGGADQLARMLAQVITKDSGLPVIVENKPGAAGMIAATYVARSNPDGKTIFVGSNAPLVVNQALYAKMTYDPVKDFALVSGIARVPLLMVVRPDLPAKNIQEIVALGRKDPGKLTMGSASTGNITHLAGEYAVSKMGFKVTHVPYQGGAAALVGVMGNILDLMFNDLPTTMEAAKAGKVRPIAVLDTKRFAGLPDVPTVAEIGYPGIEAGAWYGLAAPAGTPKAVVDQLNQAVNQALKNPDMANKLASIGAVAMPGDSATFTAFVAADRARWVPVVHSLNLKVQ